MSEPEVVLRMSLEHAKAMALGAEILTRLGLGQMTYVRELVQDGTIPPFEVDSAKPLPFATREQIDEIDDLLRGVKARLGVPFNGSRSIGHRHNHTSVHHAYEALQVLNQALAQHRDPEPTFRGHEYDGLMMRYTQSPAPSAEVVDGPEAPRGAIDARKVKALFIGRVDPRAAPEGV